MDDMVLIHGGAFRMGSDRFYPDEQPVHERTVASFRMDRYAVTNRDFERFVDATGYVTTADGRMLLFSMLCNNYSVPTATVNRIQDSVAVRLASLRLPAP